MSFDSKGGVNLKGQFNLRNTDPIDGRYVITSKEEYEEMTTLSSNSAVYLYPGLMFTVTTALVLTDGTKRAPGTYQVAADGITINKVPNITVSNELPNTNDHVIGDICIVVAKS